MDREIHICMGCGQDTKARGGICPRCYSNAEDVPSMYDNRAPRDDYEAEADRASGQDQDDYLIS